MRYLFVVTYYYRCIAAFFDEEAANAKAAEIQTQTDEPRALRVQSVPIENLAEALHRWDPTAPLDFSNALESLNTETTNAAEMLYNGIILSVGDPLDRLQNYLDERKRNLPAGHGEGAVPG